MGQQQPELRQSRSSKMCTCSATATRCNASVVAMAAVPIVSRPHWPMGPGGTVHAPSAHATAIRHTRFVVVSVCVVAGVVVVVGVSVATIVVLVSPVVILYVCALSSPSPQKDAHHKYQAAEIDKAAGEMGEETEATRTKKAADQAAAVTSSMVTAVSRAVTEAVKNAPNKAGASTATDAGYMEAATSIMKLYGEDTNFCQLQQEALGKPTSLILVKPGKVRDLRATGSRGEKRKHHNRLNDDTDNTNENNSDQKMPATTNRTVTPIHATNANVQQNAVESVQVGTRHKTPVDVDCGKKYERCQQHPAQRHQSLDRQSGTHAFPCSQPSWYPGHCWIVCSN